MAEENGKEGSEQPKSRKRAQKESDSLAKRSYSYSFLDHDNTYEGKACSKVQKELSPYEKLLRRHEAAGTLQQFRQKQKLRNKRIRENRTEEKKLHDNKLQAIRQAKYRKNKKQKLLEQKGTSGAAERQKNEDKKSKNNHAAYMREWRSKLDDAKKQMYSERRRERRKAKKAQAAASISTSPDAFLSTPPKAAEKPAGSRYKSAEALRKAASRASQADPKDPVKFAEVKAYQIRQAMKCPRKRAALEAQGLAPPMLKTHPFHQRIKEHLKNLKLKREKKYIQERKTLMGILIKNSAKSVTTLDQRWHFVAAASMLPEEQEELEQSSGLVTHGNALPQDLKQDVINFYERPESSCVIPDKKMVGKNLVPRKCLLTTVRELHKQFVEETGKSISLSGFQKLRPQHILTVDKLKRTSCLCKTCSNVIQKVEAVQSLLNSKKVSLPTDPTAIMTITICSDKEYPAKWACISRDCPDCGVESVSTFLQDLPKEKSVSWFRWQKYESGGGERLGNVTKKGSVQQLITELEEELRPLAKHLSVAHWQYAQFRHLRNNLQPGEVLTLMDFAENYRCEYQREVQSAHWSYSHATVFPTVNYYICSCGDIVTESVVIISDDLTHDASAVHAFNSTVLKHLQHTRGLRTEMQYQFTDGAASQFKSRVPFVDLSRSIDDHGIPVQRSFFGSSHGKGPCDGIAGLVKKAAQRAVLTEKVVIRDAKEMFSYLEASITVGGQATDSCCHSRRVFFFQDHATMNRNRSDRHPNNPIPGTQAIHCVRSTGEANKVEYRHLTCFCNQCVRGESCEKVDDWKIHVFKVPSSVATTHQQPMTMTSSGMTGPAASTSKTKPVPSTSKTESVPSEPVASASKTETAPSASKTEPVSSTSKTEPVPSTIKTEPVQLEPMALASKTEPAPSTSKTEPVPSTIKTEPVQLEPMAFASKTELVPSTSKVETVPSTIKTEPVQLEPMAFASKTEPVPSTSKTEPVPSTIKTEPVQLEPMALASKTEPVPPTSKTEPVPSTIKTEPVQLEPMAFANKTETVLSAIKAEPVPSTSTSIVISTDLRC